MNRNWNILQINTEFDGVFQTKSMVAFKLSKNLQEIVGGHTVKQGNVFKRSLHRQNGKSVPCSLTRPSLCCAQIVNTQAFTSQQTLFKTNMQKSVCHLFNGMYIIQKPNMLENLRYPLIWEQIITEEMSIVRKRFQRAVVLKRMIITYETFEVHSNRTIQRSIKCK